MIGEFERSTAENVSEGAAWKETIKAVKDAHPKP